MRQDISVQELQTMGEQQQIPLNGAEQVLITQELNSLLHYLLIMDQGVKEIRLLDAKPQLPWEFHDFEEKLTLPVAEALTDYTALQIQALLQQKEISTTELVQACSQVIDHKEPLLHAFISLNQDYALQLAAEVDYKRVKKYALGELAGVPLALKDNIATVFLPTTCASAVLADYYPEHNAVVTQRLLQADGIPLGKTNLDEFAMGSSTVTSAFGCSKNPYGENRSPGGSSGGSAAAVSGHEVFLALGSDTGGSIRQPAAFCGAVGLKPGKGLVSNQGVFPLAASLDQVGTLTKSVEDCALLLNVVTSREVWRQTATVTNSTTVHKITDKTVTDKSSTMGVGGRQSSSTTVTSATAATATTFSRLGGVVKEKINYLAYLNQSIKGVRIALLEEYFTAPLPEEVLAKLSAAVDVLSNLGADIQPVSLPLLNYALPVYCCLSPVEIKQSMALLENPLNLPLNFRTMPKKLVNGLLGTEVKKRMLLGQYLTDNRHYYEKAVHLRQAMEAETNDLFSRYHLLLAPVCGLSFDLAAPPVGLEMRLNDRFLAWANLTGIPSLSVPCGRVNNLPVGMQLMAPCQREERLIAVADLYEKLTKQA